jgi:lipopolysaccharide export system protein LptA
MNRLFYIATGILFFFSIASVSFLISSVTVVSAAEEKKDEAPLKVTETKSEVKPEAKVEPNSASKSANKEEPKKEEKKQSGKNSLMGGDKEPTVITSQVLTTDNKAKTALFKGAVVARKGDKTLYADSMLVYYTESSDGESSNIDRIESEGKVKLVRKDRVITSDRAVYFAGDNERAVFTGSPRAIEGKNIITGTIMTYYIKDDRSMVENSKVFLVEKEQGTQASTGKASKAEKKKKK